MADFPTILVAESDDTDVIRLQAAAKKAGTRSDLVFVRDGEALIDYFTGEGAFAPPAAPARPYLVLLDAELPGPGALAALDELRVTDECRSVPVVAWSAALEPNKAQALRSRGANSVVEKPRSIDAIARLLQRFESYWLETEFSG